jgi:hypothetical protein
MAEPQRCQDTVNIPVVLNASQGAWGAVTCGRLVVTANGDKVEHIHHRRDLDVPGCEQVRVTWTRRR